MFPHLLCANMLRRRVLYLVCLAGCIGFFVAYRAWLGWLLLLAVVGLPWLSLLLSLPAMLTIKAELSCPSRVGLGETIIPQVQMRCSVPIPPVRWHLSTYHGFVGRKIRLKKTVEILAEHCGSISVQAEKIWVYDYLGLFRRRLSKIPEQRVLVWPKSEQVPELPNLKRYIAGSWRPKPGGGFAENYDLRLYRPGDDLRQIHWKLAAKTGKLVLREPIIPIRGKLALTLLLGGTLERVDQKLGILQAVSEHLLSLELPHEIHCLTGAGMTVFPVTNAREVQQAIEGILTSELTQLTQMPPVKASWQYRIGGALDAS